MGIASTEFAQAAAAQAASLGIDPAMAFSDHAGRPVPILDEGKPISELF